ncbi:MAG: hypothetical protein COZ91_02780 [Candidatus Nealsonbacteria bacterium CG_4_8_14_3_um_filter_39_7]|uniref:Uncharacterized protein n=1 Tax=Candidatus Nealsonbacteria bacterium CG23_combo_of_CG06-09_8_20_14_all_39_17 TaxID=1974722 RepID=A0A2G9YU86_9BACT|nr:MAG: hypothetical protein COX37_02255 [Candidatus Nealsonbacteria bacterium CG23_combo_of_CG06-09_8_20_14_all_39_17]PIU43978.1 MAG: hypothetical protein COS96_01505 [Candidatus Nealsonbacteria bacterium CG07_land_8_20_14_0_80_39_13]PIW91003.1 MAG: hypothetical protein COZ91_02780 [Candidatus Nealsonbacteria bacterium CG_4_8_14_3_um_filter_39_7]
MTNIAIKWVIWYFWEMPQNILKGWRNFLLFNLNYFSIGLMLKTFFSPWKRYSSSSSSRGFEIGKFLEDRFSNLIFRILGAIVRFFLIIIGIVIEAFLILAGAFLFAFWLAIPLLIIFGISLGLRLLS